MYLVHDGWEGFQLMLLDCRSLELATAVYVFICCTNAMIMEADTLGSCHLPCLLCTETAFQDMHLAVLVHDPYNCVAKGDLTTQLGCMSTKTSVQVHM